MIKRIVEVSKPSRIQIKDRQLLVEQDGTIAASVAVEDLGLLLLVNPANVITQQALSACQEHGAAVVVCDGHFMPAAIMLPVAGSTLHAETIRIQASAKADVVHRIWLEIVAAKVEGQARLLAVRGYASGHLEAVVRRMDARNASQLEAQAASYYWKMLLGKGFRRDPSASGLNSLLNYGYAIMRAAVARAVVGTGLHPSLGLFHRNRYNSFALADDLIEPLRPAVDEIASGWKGAEPVDLGPNERRAMLAILSGHCSIGKERLPLWIALQRYAFSVKSVLASDTQNVEIPRWEFSVDGGPCG